MKTNKEIKETDANSSGELANTKLTSKKRIGTIGKIGSCYDCDWREEDYKKDVLKLAKEHSKRFKHDVNVEITRTYNYYGKE
jgi:hypothetical protein